MFEKVSGTKIIDPLLGHKGLEPAGRSAIGEVAHAGEIIIVRRVTPAGNNHLGWWAAILEYALF